MSVLSLKHIFGLKGDVKDNIHYVDETNVLYPAGYNVRNKNRNKTQRKKEPNLRKMRRTGLNQLYR